MNSRPLSCKGSLNLYIPLPCKVQKWSSHWLGTAWSTLQTSFSVLPFRQPSGENMRGLEEESKRKGVIASKKETPLKERCSPAPGLRSSFFLSLVFNINEIKLINSRRIGPAPFCFLQSPACFRRLFMCWCHPHQWLGNAKCFKNPKSKEEKMTF